MRRIVVALMLLAGCGAVVVGMGAGGSAGQAGYRVDAVFDRTATLIPGQQVKVAGAPVGSVVGIELTEDRRARVQMDVQEGFAPFRADARCIIRAEALIGEKFVQCDPGTTRAKPLEGDGDDPPTVPLERNSVPVEIDTILATFRRPYRERLRILLAEFGVGLAGRADDLDATIRRANPALREANELLRVLARERRSLADLVDGTDAALVELAARRRGVQSFIERSDAVAEATASRRDDLSEAVRLLPTLLAEAQPSVERLSSFAREATPVARLLREAAPAVNTLLKDVAPLSEATVPALERLGRTARIGRRAVRAAIPVADHLAPAARELPDVVKTATGLVESLRETGGVENILTFVYYAAAATARYDSISHMLPAFLIGNDCSQYSEVDTPGCEDGLGGLSATAQRDRDGDKKRPRRRRAGRRAPADGGEAPAEPAPKDEPGLLDSRPQLPSLPSPVPPQLKEPSGIPLLDWLLGP